MDEYKWCCRFCGSVFNGTEMQTKYHKYGNVFLGQKCCPRCRSSDITCISLPFRPVDGESHMPTLTSFHESEDDDEDFFSQFWESGVVTDQEE